MANAMVPDGIDLTLPAELGVRTQYRLTPSIAADLAEQRSVIAAVTTGSFTPYSALEHDRAGQPAGTLLREVLRHHLESQKPSPTPGSQIRSITMARRSRSPTLRNRPEQRATRSPWCAGVEKSIGQVL